MDKLTLWEVFIFSVPEATVIISIALGLAGVKFDVKKVTFISIVMGILLYFVRPLVTSYILNVMVYVTALVILFLVFGLMDIFRSIMSVIFSVSIYLVIEYLNVNAIQFIFDVDPLILIHNYAMRFVSFIPQLAMASLFSFLIRKYKWSPFSE